MLRPALQIVAVFVSWVTATAALADPQYFHKTLSGRIGDRHGFTMNLKNVDGRLTGSYRPAGKRNDLYLSGEIDPSGALTMNAFGSAGQRTGTFTGKLVSDTLDGNWASADGDRPLPVYAHQTSEIIMGSKREMLTQAIGTYVLDSVSGAGCPSGVWQSWRDKGRWKSNFSVVEDGHVEVSDVSLTREDLHRLNSMTVTLDTSLATRLSVEGKVLLSIPYRDAGMQYEISQPHHAGIEYQISQPPNSVMEDHLKSLSPATSVYNEHLYLLARDAIDFAPAMAGNYLSNEVGVVTVSYAVVGKTFDVYLRDDNGCSGSVFSFRRKGR
ncbi:hypothetical protein CF161_08421 [Pseudomonas sp. CF161]|nr:hypothetical protein CF161_08421 [Pseudomonas sp. CF161]